MSDYELQSYDDESYMNILPKKFMKNKERHASQKNRVILTKQSERNSYVTTQTSMQSPLSTNHTQHAIDNNACGQLNISHTFVRSFYKTNPNTPFRKKSLECYENSGPIAQNHFDYSPYKLIKQTKQDKSNDKNCMNSHKQSISAWQPIKNIQNIEFDSQKNSEKQKKQSLANIQNIEEDELYDQILIQGQNTQSSPKKRQIFKSAFSNLLQQNKNQTNLIVDEKKRIEDLQKGLVIKNLRPKTIFTNAKLVQTQQNCINQSLIQRKSIAITPGKQRILKNNFNNRPASSSKANKKLPYSDLYSNEKQILSFVQGDKMSKSFIVTNSRNETPVRDQMRSTNLSFYTGDFKEQKQLLDLSKSFRSVSRPRTAGSQSRSPKKQIQSTNQTQASPNNVNLLYKRFSQQNSSTLHLELEKDFSFQVLGKSSQIFSSPNHKENQSVKKIDGNIALDQTEQIKELDDKFKEVPTSPSVNNSTAFNSRNILKKHHFVKNVADISLFDKNKKVQMDQFVFESPSPSRRAALRQNVNDNFFTSLNCVEIFNL
ncbi:hypothetical protein TTHERM_00467490 (macronuclear) [Tetrahymena thermophila SB210]|uniref:Uncharacterized protein n=1 Tax=Tetrahymena thermophila (strain SB210) TaxID=312017 RepID=I7MMG3_TETTS|nr:hypothetical protein TTHERM_00467490 [Tetrahymena thermophila SB210]EAS04800.1 hypothetical protein TTHERM_00467490 [Tetrahymena thermophila SB210]|eukprot:XP_001025045.1 hypothetical protein TTHERM_00467490 [Tetrahymena thermophila SB210]